MGIDGIGESAGFPYIILSRRQINVSGWKGSLSSIVFIKTSRRAQKLQESPNLRTALELFFT
jgi:hypothetical protein